MQSAKPHGKRVSNERFARTNIVIDQNLLEDAMEFSGLTTRRAVVNEALRLYVQMQAQQELKKLRGKVTWEGDLDAMREDRHWHAWDATEDVLDAELVTG